MKDPMYDWWKRRPTAIRKALVFMFGIFLLCLSALLGPIPGPGGIPLFLLAIAVLASEFDWAEQVRTFFMHTVPRKVKDRWEPTRRWLLWIDITALLLLFGALVFAIDRLWLPTISFGFSGFFLALFNRHRLDRLKARLRRK